MAAQFRHLLALADERMPPVRVIPNGAPMWEHWSHNFNVLSFAGIAD